MSPRRIPPRPHFTYIVRCLAEPSCGIVKTFRTLSEAEARARYHRRVHPLHGTSVTLVPARPS